MTSSLFGMTVTRSIPAEVLHGLITGEYRLYGGVIRGAPGTEIAGQIVRHLIPVGGQLVTDPMFGPVNVGLQTVNALQLRRLSGQVGALTTATQQVLQVANATMMLSGLNLAVSLVGFAVISQQLKRLDSKLNEIQQEVKAIRLFLELKERSELKAALRDLITAMGLENRENRRTLLFNAKNILSPISLKYQELLSQADSLETGLAYEEYYCLTSLAHARCVAELGMLDVAHKELNDARETWQTQARRLANQFILGDEPERFLYSDFSAELPVATLVEYLDFAAGEEKGFDRLDDLRGKMAPYYRAKTGKRFAHSIKTPVGKPRKIKFNLQSDKARRLPALAKLTARNNVIEGYAAQYQLLAEAGVTPSEFENQVTQLQAEEAVEGFYILDPAQAVN